jgi:putative peptidoglycan lipid II flippase
MQQKLVKTASIFSFTTFLSRLLGFVRDSIVAQLFGVGPAMDAFCAAYKIPSLMHKLFAESALVQVFIPILSEYRETKEPKVVRQFIAQIVGMLMIILTIIIVFGMSMPSLWIRMVASKLDAERLQIASDLLRISFPYLLLVSLAALGSATMNCYGRFWGAALTPVWPNICLIIAALGFSHLFLIPTTSLAWGIILTGVVQFLFVLPFLKSLALLVWPRFDGWKMPDVRKMGKLILPALFCASTDQLMGLINTQFASALPTGTLTWLHYANRLIYFPLGVLGVALATAVLPLLSRTHAARTVKKFDAVLGWGLRCGLMLGMPAAIVFGVLAGPLIASLLGYGKFSSLDIMQTKQALLGYAFGLPAFMLVRVLSTGFFAQQNVHTPGKILLQVIIVNILLNCLFISHLGLLGLTLASSLAAWLQVALLLRQLWRPGMDLKPSTGWWRWSGGLLGINAVLGVLLYTMTPALSQWLAWTAFYRLLLLSGLIGAAILLYLLGLWWSGCKKKDVWVSI